MKLPNPFMAIAAVLLSAVLIWRTAPVAACSMFGTLGLVLFLMARDVRRGR